MTTRLPVHEFALPLDEPRGDFARRARAVCEAAAQFESDREKAEPGFVEEHFRRRRDDREWGEGAVLPGSTDG